MKSIYERLAAFHGCTAEDVEAEICSAIREGMNADNPDVQRNWRRMLSYGETPSAEEVLSYCVTEVLRRTSAK